MYKFNVTRRFDKETGRVCSKIAVVQTDTGLPSKIIQVGDSLSDNTTLWAEAWKGLNKMEEDFIHELKLKIDRIRDNREHVPQSYYVEY